MLSPEDATMLRELLAESPDEDEEVRFQARAFREMLTRDWPLSVAQRSWLKDTHERICGVPKYENLVSSGRVPRGREVPTPAVLLNLPKKPPHRRSE